MKTFRLSIPRNTKERAQSMVEFAVSITIVLILLAGLVDLGRAFFTFTELRDAAQEGAFYGSVHAIVDTNANGAYDEGEPVNTSDIVSRVRGASDTPVDLSDTTDVTVNVSASDPPCAGGTITVDVSYNYQIIMPLLGAIIGSQTIPITAHASNTILWPACEQ